jgi:hypothetical protein
MSNPYRQPLKLKPWVSTVGEELAKIHIAADTPAPVIAIICLTPAIVCGDSGSSSTASLVGI